MEYNNEEYISPHWPGFRRLWWIVAIILFLLLLIMWFLGYGPGGKACPVPVEIRTVEKLVTAPDTTAPLISLNNDSVLRLTTGESYVEAGARAIDGTDGKMTVTTKGVVDTSTAGEYTITYSVTDAAGNTAMETRKIIISDPMSNSSDADGPVITLNAASTIYLETGDNYNDAGATAFDATDGNISVTVKGSVDPQTVGEYTVIYTATDTAGNTSTAIRRVIVSAAARLLVSEPEKSVPDARLYFGYDNDQNPADSDDSLAVIVSYLKGNSGATALVSGFHDPTGNKAYNQDLAYRRAATVAAMLRAAGIAEDRIILEKPVETEGSGAPGEARRVEVKIASS